MTEGKAPAGSRDERAPTVSAWVCRFAGWIPAAGAVLDLAAGSGRHSRLLLARGHPVTALDWDVSQLERIHNPKLEVVRVDLEDGSPFALTGRRFAGVVVTNYLHRPLLTALVEAVAPGGLLLYETFAQGNEAFGKPSNPAFLLRPGELLEAVAGQLRVLAYENLTVASPRPAAVQRIAARRDTP